MYSCICIYLTAARNQEDSKSTLCFFEAPQSSFAPITSDSSTGGSTGGGGTASTAASTAGSGSGPSVSVSRNSSDSSSGSGSAVGGGGLYYASSLPTVPAPVSPAPCLVIGVSGIYVARARLIGVSGIYGARARLIGVEYMHELLE